MTAMQSLRKRVDVYKTTNISAGIVSLPGTLSMYAMLIGTGAIGGSIMQGLVPTALGISVTVGLLHNHYKKGKAWQLPHECLKNACLHAEAQMAKDYVHYPSRYRIDAIMYLGEALVRSMVETVSPADLLRKECPTFVSYFGAAKDAPALYSSYKNGTISARLVTPQAFEEVFSFLSWNDSTIQDYVSASYWLAIVASWTLSRPENTERASLAREALMRLDTSVQAAALSLELMRVGNTSLRGDARKKEWFEEEVLTVWDRYPQFAHVLKTLQLLHDGIAVDSTHPIANPFGAYNLAMGCSKPPEKDFALENLDIPV